ncbi:cytochrome c oxidase subunit II [Phormidium sp. CCY1219]|uniref:cytochrome c oxidase subunit II n=1 Tax=Phormidium sp. CCY1219 TaxID=2886104 RepID=UPI002D1F57FF|nr:cytochrome c oxidase subunit II [Phormidium sp. CCY1219]MEB3830801.1 cytochrome c oxidase subunit II [Phormidium sp. CCY1219]
MKIPSAISAMLAGIGLTLISLWYGQNHGLMPIAASEEAPWVDGLFNTMMTIATGLFVLVQGIIIVAIWRFRQRPGDDSDGPPIHGNVPLEVLWTAIPAVLIMGIGIYSFEVYNSMGGLDPMASHDSHTMQAQAQPGAAIAATLPENEPEADATPSKAKKMLALGVGASPKTQGQSPFVNVNVLGLQFAWIFTYPDLGITSGELHMPAGKEVQLTISANDVIHALWIPEFRLKQDAIPGRETELRFVPQTVGNYPLLCAELCGSYHGGMKTRAIVHTPEDYQAWVESQLAAQPESGNTVAINPAELSESDYLEPLGAEMGITPEAIAQLHN